MRTRPDGGHLKPRRKASGEADTSVLDFQPQNCGKINFCCLVFCCDSPGKPIQYTYREKEMYPNVGICPLLYVIVSRNMTQEMFQNFMCILLFNPQNSNNELSAILMSILQRGD